MSQAHFRLAQVEALPGYRLRLTYADGQTWEIDLTDWIDATDSLRRSKTPSCLPRPDWASVA